jgi:cytochrome c biogenesis protein CcmG/thiol:disulfide interchange protein DsbE
MVIVLKKVVQRRNRIALPSKLWLRACSTHFTEGEKRRKGLGWGMDKTMESVQRGRRRERWIGYAVGVAAFVLVAWALHHGTRQSGGIAAASERRVMPALVLAQLDGGTWRMEDHRGQVVLVNYWATWCGPCWEETPGLVRLSRELGSRGLAVVGVSVDEGGREKVRQFVDRFKLPYPVALQEPMSQMAQGMAGVPTTILVDKQGRVAKTYVGAVEERDFRKDVNALLGER